MTKFIYDRPKFFSLSDVSSVGEGTSGYCSVGPLVGAVGTCGCGTSRSYCQTGANANTYCGTGSVYQKGATECCMGSVAGYGSGDCYNGYVPTKNCGTGNCPMVCAGS
jgi:hypothetical protein